METTDIIKIVATQSVVFIAAIALAFFKLRHDLRLDREKHITAHRLVRLEQQLSEFYAPLHMLSLTAKELVGATWDTPEWERAFKDGLLPLHEQMEDILTTRAHLLDMTIVPDSYVRFLKHIRLVRCYADTGLTKSYFEREEEFPNRFNHHIAEAYRLKREEYIREFRLQETQPMVNSGFQPEFANEG